jgi:hypothetical protein
MAREDGGEERERGAGWSDSHREPEGGEGGETQVPEEMVAALYNPNDAWGGDADGQPIAFWGNEGGGGETTYHCYVLAAWRAGGAFERAGPGPAAAGGEGQAGAQGGGRGDLRSGGGVRSCRRDGGAVRPSEVGRKAAGKGKSQDGTKRGALRPSFVCGGVCVAAWEGS